MKRTLLTLFVSVAFVAGCGNSDRFAKVTNPNQNTNAKATATAEKCKKDDKLLSLTKPKACVDECRIPKAKGDSSGACACESGFEFSEKEQDCVEAGSESAATNTSSIESQYSQVRKSENMTDSPVVGAASNVGFKSKSLEKTEAKDISCTTMHVQPSAATPVQANIESVENLLKQASKDDVYRIIEVKLINKDKGCLAKLQPDFVSNYEVRVVYELLEDNQERTGTLKINLLGHGQKLEGLGSVKGMKVFASCLDKSCDQVAIVAQRGGQAEAAKANIKNVKVGSSVKANRW